jgi:hypothetical protein
MSERVDDNAGLIALGTICCILFSPLVGAICCIMAWNQNKVSVCRLCSLIAKWKASSAVAIYTQRVSNKLPSCFIAALLLHDPTGGRIN